MRLITDFCCNFAEKDRSIGMPKTERTELFPVVDGEGWVTGCATRGECHDGKSMLLHPVVHLHVLSADLGAILLQRRSMSKDIQPGRWDTAVGGHVDYGETVADALMREAREELGIDASEARPLCRYEWRSERERELVNVHFITADPQSLTVTPDPDEVDETRFWTLEEIGSVRGKGVLTPNFERELDRILPLISAL